MFEASRVHILWALIINLIRRVLCKYNFYINPLSGFSLEANVCEHARVKWLLVMWCSLFEKYPIRYGNCSAESWQRKYMKHVLPVPVLCALLALLS